MTDQINQLFEEWPIAKKLEDMPIAYTVMAKSFAKFCLERSILPENLKPYTSEMLNALLVNALRLLTVEQKYVLADNILERLPERSGWKSYPDNDPISPGYHVAQCNGQTGKNTWRRIWWTGESWQPSLENVTAFYEIPDFTPDPQQQTETSKT